MTDTVNVPVEPTEAMLDAARGLIMALSFNAPNPSTTLGDVARSGFYGELWGHILTDEERGLTHLTKAHRAELIYRAMLAAAPKAEPAHPEAQKGETVDEEIGEEYDIAAHCLTLAECPAGLFFWNGSLGFKSEYGAMEPDETSNGKLWRVSNRPDAYCADSGEYFWGGAKTHDERANMLVYPIRAETVAMVGSHGPADLAHPAPSSELLEALEAEISRLRPHYHGRGLDHARVQMLDHFDDFLAKRKGPQ